MNERIINQAPPSDFAAALAAGQKLAEAQVVEINGTQVLIHQQGLQVKEYESQRARPRRIERTVETTHVQSFIDYFNRFADENSTIFVDVENRLFIGIIDYHEDATAARAGGEETGNQNAPRHGCHKVTYKCPLTPEAKKWLDNDGAKKSQVEFAEFIEEGAPEIVEPNAAEMLEIALTMQAKTGVDFSSGIRLDNGQVQLTYREDIQGTAGVTGQLKIPSKIALGIQLFQGGERYRLEANFRYRLNQGRMTIWYDLIRPHLALQDAVKAIQSQIVAGKNKGQVIEAKP